MVKKFTIPFASQGDANDIPDALQVDGKVSFTQGFSYDYERPYDDPQAKDIAREDMNGIFKAITSAVGELQTLGASEWSSAISYPKGAIVYFEKDLYISQVDDNQNTPPQNWVSITSIANDSLKKAENLSDLTNKATARSNLGLGSSATLNKTDVLGTSTSLVATQKLVNDTKINLENSKQDKLTFVGRGPEVMREGAFGVGQTLTNYTRNDFGPDANEYTTNGFYGLGSGAVKIENNFPITTDDGSLLVFGDYHSKVQIFNGTAGRIFWRMNNANNTTSWEDWAELFHDKNTTTDKSGFLRASGSANALTEVDAIPIGAIQAYIGENAPNDKWLLCRGQVFSATTYSDLAKLLPDLKIPDLRGVALRGLDANRGFDPNRKLLSYQEDAMQRISGYLYSRSSESTFLGAITYGAGAFATEKGGSGGGNVSHIQISTSSGYEDRVSFNSSITTRTNSQNETVMKNVAVNFIIKAR